ncbi:unnamed protein product, partial [Ectocarpus sp. 8 AP-2014]
MGNPFSCCHPGRKEKDRGGSKVRDRLLHTQDSSTQTGLEGEEETYGLIAPPPQQEQDGSDKDTIEEQAQARRGTAHDSSSSGGSNGSYRAEAKIQFSPAGTTVGAAAAAAAAPTAAQGASSAAATAAATADQEPAVARGGREPEGLPAAANEPAPAPAAPPPPPGHRSTGAMPRAHPNDQHHRRQQ